jgi:hypothetical protein
MPKGFPASLDDFLQRIIGGSTPEERLRAYIRHTAEKFLSQPHTPLDRNNGKELLRNGHQQFWQSIRRESPARAIGGTRRLHFGLGQKHKFQPLKPHD